MSTPAFSDEFLKLYEARADSIFRYCYTRLSDREQAVDAVQEVFMRTWQYVHEGKSVQNLEAFLWTVAANLIRDTWRRKKAIPMSALATAGEDGEVGEFDVADPKEETIPTAEFRRARDLFVKLGETDHTILELRFVEDLPVKTIAEMLGERENTISVRISRALEKLKGMLATDKIS